MLTAGALEGQTRTANSQRMQRQAERRPCTPLDGGNPDARGAPLTISRLRMSVEEESGDRQWRTMFKRSLARAR